MTRLAVNECGGPNVAAFLDMIAWSEMGPGLLAASDDGYNALVGSTATKPHLFASYADHPQVFVTLSPTLRSSAAGRYQCLARTWNSLAETLGLHDFTPESQDRGAIQLLRECHAYPQIVAGNITRAIQLASPIWASLPGAGYGQPEHKLADLTVQYGVALHKYTADFSNVTSGVTMRD